MDQSDYLLIFHKKYTQELALYDKNSTQLHQLVNLNEFNEYLNTSNHKDKYENINNQMVKLLEFQEGLTNYIYFCTAHFPTVGCGISLVHNYYDLDKNGNLVPKVVSENQEIIKKIRDALEKTNFLAVFNSLEGDARSRVAQMVDFHSKKINTNVSDQEISQLNKFTINKYFKDAIRQLKRLDPQENEISGFALTMLFDYQYNTGQVSKSPGGNKGGILRTLRTNPKEVLDNIYGFLKSNQQQYQKRRHFRSYMIWKHLQTIQ